MKRLFIDFETRSTVDLKKVGAWAYAAHPSTEIMCMAWAFDDLSGLYKIGDHIGEELDGRISREDVVVTAHNAHFEYAIYENILHKRFGWPDLSDPAKWDCTLARAAVCNLPISLDSCGAALGISAKKDMMGRSAMMKLCKPISFTPEGAPVYNEDPALKQVLYDYCRKDVAAEMEIHARLPELSPAERRVWELDLVINKRGVLMDTALAANAEKMVDALTTELNEKLHKLTNGAVDKASRVAEIKRYLASRGVNVLSLDKASVAELLKREDIPADVKEVIDIRRQVGKTSTSKYTAILEVASLDDNRARGLLQYHGAATGRWAGRLIQPHNFPKGVKQGDQKVIIDAIKAGDFETLSLLFGSGAMDAMSAALRGAIIAPPGKKLMVADYSAIEARVVLWLAGDERALEMFRKGVSLYIDMAEFIYQRKGITKDDNPHEYAVGKMAILGCFEKDTPVLTDSGWKSILSVTQEDRLWDGVEWVKHDGVKYQGDQDIIHFAGIGVTPDHLFLTHEDKWEPACQVARENTSFLKSMTESVASTLPGLSSAPAGEWSRYRQSVRVDERQHPTPPTCGEEELLGATYAPKNKPQSGKRSGGGIQPSFPTMATESVYSTESLRRSSVATTKTTLPSSTTGVGESGSSVNGAKIERSSSDILPRLKVGMTRFWRWIVETLIPGTNQATSVSLADPEICVTVEESEPCRIESVNSKRRSPVYDVINAGPRNRFTILTSEGPFIVHNCGYGMGKDRFQAQCATFGVDITLDLAAQAVRAYRDRYVKVKNMWYDVENAAKRAVRDPGPVQWCCGSRVAFGMDRKREFLVCRLPSGRFLRYFKPSLVGGQYGEELHYQGPGLGGVLEDQSTYGGSLVENITQAVARDLMAHGMLNLELAGYPVILTVHDELISEVPLQLMWEIEDFVRLICDTPEWAAGCPIAAEGWSGLRYRK